MIDDIFDSIPDADDDVIINLHFHIIFCEKAASVSFQEEWIQDSIKNEFKNYNCNNYIRLSGIRALNNQVLLFDLRQINPDITIAEIIDKITIKLEKLIEGINYKVDEEFWQTIEVFSVGNNDDVMKEIMNYIKKLRK